MPAVQVDFAPTEIYVAATGKDASECDRTFNTPTSARWSAAPLVEPSVVAGDGVAPPMIAVELTPRVNVNSEHMLYLFGMTAGSFFALGFLLCYVILKK